jgi:perosamine synthetase
MIPGARPHFSVEDRKEILEKIDQILRTGALTQGTYQKEFEASGAAMAGTKFAFAVNSGGTALELVMEALNLKGGEVIVPTQTFVASPNSVVRAGGLPVFADIDKDTLNLSAKTVEPLITANTRAVMVVHMFGLISPDIAELQALCEERGLALIEDAAHAHGATCKEGSAGGLGLAGCFSYFATKVLTSGEGGLITTNNEELAAKLTSLRNHGRDAGGPTFGLAGNNFRMPEISALLGVVQHRSINQILTHRRAIAEVYRSILGDIPDVALVDQNDSGSSYWRYTILLPDGIDRDQLQSTMATRYDVRITWMYEPLCHKQPFYLNPENEVLPVAESTICRLVNLPTHVEVSEGDANRIAIGVRDTIAEMLQVQ